MATTLGFLFLLCLPLMVQGSSECNSSCFTPQPPPAAPTESEIEVQARIRCTIGCVQEHGVSVEVLGDGTAWPTMTLSQLQNNCVLYQKVQQCRSACVARFKDPTLTINRCRDQCYDTCRDACGGATSCTQAGSVCNKSCRKTYYRFGCQLYDALTNSEVQNSQQPLSPVSAPILTPVQKSAGHFHINVSEAMPLLDKNSQAEVVAYLFKVESHEGRDVAYYWQDELQQSLDLSAFSCTHISVSFAVVNKYQTSNYSPGTGQCIHGVGGKPSQVDRSSIGVQYTEDNRPDFLGYAVANISWERPEESYQFLTSYTIRIFSETAECGGPNVLYSYNNISREVTNFILTAERPNGLLKFGCSYQFSMLSLPADPEDSGTHRILTPALLDPSPQLNLRCIKLWDKNGYFNISVHWSLQNTSSSEATLRAIKHFQLSPILKDNRFRGLLGTIESYDTHTVLPQQQQMQYSTILTLFQPQHITTYKYQIELRTVKNVEYFWRSVPRLQSCIIDSRSEPPTPVTSLDVANLTFDRVLGRLQLAVSWNHPEIANGEVVEYELQIEGKSAVNLQDPVEMNTTFYSQTLQVASALINITVQVNDDVHCLFLKVRARNQFVYGEWSQPETISLDAGCSISNASNTTVSPMPDVIKVSNESKSQISVYYENGNDTIKLLELDCSGTGDPSDLGSERIHAGLQRLEEQLELIADQVDRPAAGPQLLERIESIERKLDAITELLSSHVHK